MHRAAGKYETGLDNEVFRSGKSSYRLNCTEINLNGANAFRYAWARLIQRAEIESSKSYTFRVWYRTQKDYSGQVRIWLLGDDVKHEFTAYDTNGLWQEVLFTNIKTEKEKTKVSIYLNTIKSVGTVWFDDAELTPEN